LLDCPACSVTDNDENMLLIRGDTRVADIFFGEFMRVFAHTGSANWSSVTSRSSGLPRPTPGGRRTCSRTGASGCLSTSSAGSEKDIKRRDFAAS